MVGRPCHNCGPLAATAPVWGAVAVAIIVFMPLVSPESLAPRLSLFITGITGVAGYNAFHYFQKRYPGQVFGTRPRVTWRLSGEGIVAARCGGCRGDARSLPHLSLWQCAQRGRQLRPEIVRARPGHGADGQRRQCDQPHGQRLSAYGARVVHLSSDLVFSGQGAAAISKTIRSIRSRSTARRWCRPNRSLAEPIRRRRC